MCDLAPRDVLQFSINAYRPMKRSVASLACRRPACYHVHFLLMIWMNTLSSTWRAAETASLGASQHDRQLLLNLHHSPPGPSSPLDKPGGFNEAPIAEGLIRPFDVVALVALASAHLAIQTLLRDLPPDFSVPIIFWLRTAPSGYVAEAAI